jgi:hypothetical protein
LAAKRLLVESGTIVDSTIIAVPSSTKHAAQARDPETCQTQGREYLILRDEAARRDRPARAGAQFSRRPVRRRGRRVAWSGAGGGRPPPDARRAPLSRPRPLSSPLGSCSRTWSSSA